MLFSWAVDWPSQRSNAMESTTAGMEVEKVRPALRPKYTLAAVNTTHSTMPMRMPRSVISLSGAAERRSPRPLDLAALLGLALALALLFMLGYPGVCRYPRPFLRGQGPCRPGGPGPASTIAYIPPSVSPGGGAAGAVFK